ncbi:MAG: oligosaccharide flippase family protein, partial [Candidatus Eisenbacteria bacterium]|nr:oligosaccharide flippase family protein [Candidatus Eisenbacteria bacterium]
MSIRQDTLRTLVFQFLMLAAGMVTNIVVARTLGPEGKGLLSFLRYALFVTINLGGLGLHAAAIQHIGKRRFPPPTIAATQIVLALALGAICAAAMALILPLYRDKMELQPAVWLSFLPVLVVSLVHLNLSGVLVGLGRIRDDNVIRLLSPLAWMTGAVVVLALLRGDKTAGALTWIAAQSVSAVAAILWIWIVARPRFVRLAGCARASLRFGFEVYLANL